MADPALGKKLLLISNSVCHDKPYLKHCAAAIRHLRFHKIVSNGFNARDCKLGFQFLLPLRH